MNRSQPTVSVIMNVFRRQSSLNSQLTAVLEQTCPVNEILIWCNSDLLVTVPNLEQPPIIVAKSSRNLGVWARFAFALNAKSDFVWFLDDDVIPGERWLESALDAFRDFPGVIGSRGLRFATSNSYLLYQEFGPNSQNEGVERVDLVGHNWVFPREWLGFFWSEYPSAFKSPYAGEDIHLVSAIQKHLGLSAFVPPHPRDRAEVWGELNASETSADDDSVAISKKKGALKLFEDAYRHYISRGFLPLSARNGESKELSLSVELGSKLARYWPTFVLNFARLLKFRKK